MKRALLIASGIVAVMILTACSKQPQEQHYQLEGTVVTIDTGHGEIMVDHKAIPGFMQAMTMPYGVKDEHELATVKVGDRIVADLVVDRANDRVWLQHIHVAGSPAR